MSKEQIIDQIDTLWEDMNAPIEESADALESIISHCEMLLDSAREMGEIE